MLCVAYLKAPYAGGRGFCRPASIAWLLIAMSSLALALPAGMPASVDVAGEQLSLASCGVREVLWVDVYSAGLYLRAGAGPGAAADPREPAALALVVLSPMHLPYRMPGKWRDALAQGLDADAMERVERAYRGLGEGDRLLAAYAPGHGATLRVNDRPIARALGHGLIGALLATWADGRPVGQHIRRIALEHPCP